jgi:sporulation protein YlmC with PRC-barrel domain
MKKSMYSFTLTTLALACVIFAARPVAAQVAGGTTTVGMAVVESTQIAMGWSVKKTLLGKTIYNDAGQKVGKVEDLIISPDKSVSYVIVGAGGFLGMGRHDVAIPVMQIQDKAGKLVMPSATKDMIKSMPEFTYLTDSTRRDQFVAAAEKDIAKGRTKLSEMTKKASTAATEAKSRMDLQITNLQVDVKLAETKLAEMKSASASRWKEFEAGVNAATARMKKSMALATG